MTREALGIGIAGLGRMGRIHAENLATRVFAARLVRVVDELPELARAIGERLDVPWSLAYDDLLNDEAVEAVVIATPTPLHAQMVEQAAAAGKHIYCEKPLALQLDPSRRAALAARERGVALQVGFHRRFDPDLAAVRARVRADELGQIYLYRASFREMTPPGVDYLKFAGDLFLDTCIHDLDTARWLVGEIDEVAAMGNAGFDPIFQELSEPDTAVVTLRFTNGALGVIDNSRVGGYGYEATTEIVGEKATARTGYALGPNQVEWLRSGRRGHELHVDFADRYLPAYRKAVQSFALALQERTSVSPSADDAEAALVLAQAASRSSAEGRPVKPTANDPERLIASRTRSFGDDRAR